MPTVRERAPAKVNLTLHVTGQRPDGYHLLDSLVVFVDVADAVEVTLAPRRSLQVVGPRAAGVPADASNLVWKAAEVAAPSQPVAVRLEKHLPAAAGIGGGSSDAAATLRAVCQAVGAEMPSRAALTRLGADVPVCLDPRPTRMGGVGDVLSPVPTLPRMWLVLANPGVAVATPEVFGALSVKDNAPMPPEWPAWPDAAALADWLGDQRNDLQGPACSHAPVIPDVLTELAAQPDCLLARMSGSGATCFGLFAASGPAEEAATALTEAHPSWWVASGAVLV